MTYSDETRSRLTKDAGAILARYPKKRSAILPLLHLVQSEDGYVSPDGIAFCAETLNVGPAEVSAVATFYTQFRRRPAGEYHIGVCTNPLCALMGGDEIWEALSDYVARDKTGTTRDGKVSLERIECNAACDYAPVVMINWEYFDNQTPESVKAIVDDLRAGKDVKPTRGADKVCTFKEVSRILAGFGDGRANEGPSAGPASLAGLDIATGNKGEAS